MFTNATVHGSDTVVVRVELLSWPELRRSLETHRQRNGVVSVPSICIHPIISSRRFIAINGPSGQKDLGLRSASDSNSVTKLQAGLFLFQTPAIDRSGPLRHAEHAVHGP